MTQKTSFDYYNKDNNFAQSSTFFISYSPNPINLPKGGIEKKNISDINESLLSDLTCPICLNIVWNPVECNECGNIFCEYCAKKISNSYRSYCPICKKIFVTRQSKGLKKILSKIRIKCPYRFCKKNPQYFDYVKHLEDCDYRLYHCKNDGCEYQDVLINMKYHTNECKYRIIKCKFCSKNIKAYTFEKHEKNECTQEIICPKCHETMTRGYFWSNHYNENNENIECLKGQASYYQNLLEEYQQKMEDLKITYNKEITKYKNDISKAEKEKKTIKNKYIKLKEDFDNWRNSFRNFYVQTNKDYENEDEQKNKALENGRH